MFVKKYPIHIILICHPRKTEGGRVESEFDIKGSATAVQECANVILFNRPKKEDVDGITRTWSQRELVFKKIRKRGMYVNKPIWLDYANGRYTELENQSIDGPGSNRSNNGWRMPNAIKSSTKNHF
jgi:hypothetical protein